MSRIVNQHGTTIRSKVDDHSYLWFRGVGDKMSIDKMSIHSHLTASVEALETDRLLDDLEVIREGGTIEGLEVAGGPEYFAPGPRSFTVYGTRVHGKDEFLMGTHLHRVQEAVRMCMVESGHVGPIWTADRGYVIAWRPVGRVPEDLWDVYDEALDRAVDFVSDNLGWPVREGRVSDVAPRISAGVTARPWAFRLDGLA